MNLRIFFVCIIGILGLHSSAFAQTATEIIQRMEKNMRGETLLVEMEMDIVRPRFTRTIGIKSWAMGEDFSMILITAPTRDRGTSYLKRQREIWNWVPSIERTIKLPPSMMSQSWMGSDFTNDDLVRESSTIHDYTHSIKGSEKIQDYDCYIIEMIPKTDAAVVYGRILLWITKEGYLQLRAENYDEYGALVSTILSSDIKKMDDRMVPTRLEMLPTDKPGQKTVLRYLNMQFNRPLDEAFFSVQRMRDLR
jgi:outer membrane lipoprotein-sorting protein